MFQDLRFGFKLLWKEKAFTVTALLTLALCIGANTAIFSVLHAVILAPLPFPESDRLVAMGNVYPGAGIDKSIQNSIPDYYDRRGMTDVFESVALYIDAGFDAGAEGSPVRLKADLVTPSFFHVLRASPLMGRLFTEDDAVLDKNQFVILSYGLWKEMFAKDAAILGRDVRLSGVNYRVVGVMPEAFSFPGREARLWVPLTWTQRQTTDDGRHSNNWNMIARLQPGATVTAVRRRVDALNRHNVENSGKLRKILEAARFATNITTLKDELIGDVRPTLVLLQCAVAFVLLIGCVNVANLMLVRSSIRMKELAIRYSLGAGRARLAMQLLIEAMALAAIGGLCGLLTGAAGIRLLELVGTADLPRGTSIAMDGSVLAFSAAIAVLTGLVFGSVPVYHLVRRDLNAVFRSTERTGTTEKRTLWTRSALVVCQVSLAFVLLIGSGLLTLSFARLLAVDPGFSAQNVQTAQFSLPRSRYKEDVQLRNFLGPLLADIRAIPGVTAAGATDSLPFGGDVNASALAVEGYSAAGGELPPVPNWSHIDAGYLPAMQIPLRAGRYFQESDTADSPKVALIDEFLARKYWPAGKAVGGHIRAGIEAKDTPYTVDGVVGTIKPGDLADQSPRGAVYFDYKQSPARTVHVVVKTAAANQQAVSAVRASLLKADPEVPLFDIKTMPERVSGSVRDRKAAMLICLVFALLALALSAIGIYGVLAYTVAQRTREFGIRMALGATAADVVGMVVKHGVRLAALGLAFGIATAFAVTRLMTTLLYGVRPTDPAIFLAVAAALMTVAIIASVIPSFRVTRIRPATALRSE
uniref:Permease n=1 Tax=Solibacter usitatus (strain Ellin6076) TaxID=234267 RepID=Q01YN6_SOLUE